MTVTIDEDTASFEFDRFAEMWEIEPPDNAMTDEDRQSYDRLRRQLVKAILRGRLVVGDDGNELRYTLQHNKEGALSELVMTPPSGQALLEFDKFTDKQGMHKVNAFMGAMCGKTAGIFRGMDGRDLKIPQAVATLFLAS